MDDDGATDAGWLEQHANVLFDIDERGRITRLNEPDPETGPPLVFLARARASRLVRFRADAPAEVVAAVTAAVSALGPWTGRPTDDATLDALRRAAGAVGDVPSSHGPAFQFGERPAVIVPPDGVVIGPADAHLLDRSFPYTRSVLADRSPVVGIVRDGAVVAACYSARRRRGAAEAGVDTIESYRRQGFAVAVVSAWAAAARRAGMTPLYSTTWDNVASLRVAERLGLEAYADTWSIG